MSELMNISMNSVSALPQAIVGTEWLSFSELQTCSASLPQQQVTSVSVAINKCI